MTVKLAPSDFARAAAALKCDVAAVRAVVEVESPKGGFNPDGSLTSLFEAHHFSRLTGGRFDKTNPGLSSGFWNRRLYGQSWQAERFRLEEAMKLDREAALKSTSFGMFQIMGFNHQACGYDTVTAFVVGLMQGEDAQLDAFVNFIRSERLGDELREHRWADFARRYNGPGFAQNQYDVKLARAHERYSA